VQVRYVTLNLALFVFAIAGNYGLGFLNLSVPAIVQFLAVLIVALSAMFACFGKKVLFWKSNLKKEWMLEEARYILIIVGALQLLYPLVPTDEGFLYVDFAFGVLMIGVYVIKNYWATLGILLIYSIFILAQNLESRETMLAIPSIIAIGYELLFLFYMGVVGKQKNAQA